MTKTPAYRLMCSVNSTGLEGLGVGNGDYLIVNDQTMDDVNDIDDDCKMQNNGGGVSLTFDLTQCNPTIEVSLQGMVTLLRC